MKKVLKLFAILAAMLIVLTGCVDVDYQVTLNKDGSADVSYVYGFEKVMLEGMGAEAGDTGMDTSGMRESAEKDGFTVENYSDDEIEGIKATKHITDLSEISLEKLFGEEYVSEKEGSKITVKKSGSKTTFSQNAEIDLSEMAGMESYVTMKYTINLPVAAKTNNANKVSNDGKTLTWELKAGEVNKIQFEAVSGGMSTVLKIALIVVGIAIILCVITIFVVKFIKNTKNGDSVKKEDSKENIEPKEIKEVVDETEEEKKEDEE